MDQIRRIEEMEAIFDAAGAALARLEAAAEEYLSLAGDLRRLEAYYTGGQWLRDYQDDEAGRLPRALKRGVLSQDGVDDLLAAEKRMLALLKGLHRPGEE
ncbi:MAG: DUF4298 domain-containing protein [Clostridia bacterium]|nr:DUF4298 domain-containing protein [Clostridia bacterium]